jgi:hypothetical protein
MIVESTGEKLTEREREQAAVRALREKLIWIEQQLLLLREKRAARFCYRAYWELTEAPTRP